MSSEKKAIPVSVVIPCFRSAKTLERALISVFNQTISPEEIIIVDDASDDDTAIRIQHFVLQNESWIKAIYLKENQGAANARNVGWEVATQPYIAFLDADDTWHPEKIRLQYAYMVANPDVAISGHLCSVVEGNHAHLAIPTEYEVIAVSSKQLIFRNYFSTPTVMLRSELPIRFQEKKRYAEDLALWQETAFAGYKVVRLEIHLAYLHKAAYGENGLSANFWQMEKGELENLLKLYGAKKISIIVFLIATIFSTLKFSNRLIRSSIQKIKKEITKWY